MYGINHTHITVSYDPDHQHTSISSHHITSRHDRSRYRVAMSRAAWPRSRRSQVWRYRMPEHSLDEWQDEAKTT